MNQAVGMGERLVGPGGMECWEDILEGTRSCFGIEQMPMQGDWGRWNFHCADEGSVEDGPVLTQEEDWLVRGPSEMDSVRIATWKASLAVKGV